MMDKGWNPCHGSFWSQSRSPHAQESDSRQEALAPTAPGRPERKTRSGRRGVRGADKSQARPARSSEPTSRWAKRDRRELDAPAIRRARSLRPRICHAGASSNPAVGAKFSGRRNLQNLAPKTLKSLARRPTLDIWSDATEARRRHVIASRETAADRRACRTSLLVRFARNDGVPQRVGLGATPIAAARLNSRTQ